MEQVGNHKRVWEYDGAFKCLDCQSQWGALTGNPAMPNDCIPRPEKDLTNAPPLPDEPDWGKIREVIVECSYSKYAVHIDRTMDDIKAIFRAQLPMRESAIIEGLERQLAEARGEVERLKEFQAVVHDAHYLILNANDIWAWGCADCCQMETEKIPLLVEMNRRWGFEGHIAFMSEGENLEPQDAWFTRKNPIDRNKYLEAKAWIKGKDTGIFRSCAYDELKLSAQIKRADALAKEADNLRGDIQSQQWEWKERAEAATARADASEKDAKRLVFACSNEFSYVEFAHHVIKTGGTGDIGDCRTFIDAVLGAPT